MARALLSNVIATSDWCANQLLRRISPSFLSHHRHTRFTVAEPAYFS